MGRGLKAVEEAERSRLLEGEVWQPASMEQVGCSQETPDNRWEWSLWLLQLGHECHLVNPLSSYPGLGFRPQT